MSGFQRTNACLICHRPTHLTRLLCWRCAMPEPEREPTTEWRRRRMESRQEERGAVGHAAMKAPVADERTASIWARTAAWLRGLF